jgi:hypothetical protein
MPKLRRIVASVLSSAATRKPHQSHTAMERLSIDFKGPLPTATRNAYILAVVDEYSRFPFAFQFHVQICNPQPSSCV